MNVENKLILDLFCFEKKSENQNEWFFSSIEFFRIIKHISRKNSIRINKIEFEDDFDNLYSERDDNIKDIKIVKEFSSFFGDESKYSINELDVEIKENFLRLHYYEGDLIVYCEESISIFLPILKSFLKEEGFSDSVIKIMHENNGKYVKIRIPDVVVDVYNDYDDYIQNNT